MTGAPGDWRRRGGGVRVGVGVGVDTEGVCGGGGVLVGQIGTRSPSQGFCLNV